MDSLKTTVRQENPTTLLEEISYSTYPAKEKSAAESSMRRSTANDLKRSLLAGDHNPLHSSERCNSLCKQGNRDVIASDIHSVSESEDFSPEIHAQNGIGRRHRFKQEESPPAEISNEKVDCAHCKRELKRTDTGIKSCYCKKKAGQVNTIFNPHIQAKDVNTQADKYMEESLDDFRHIKWLLLSMFILLNFLMCIISFLMINL
ncbi:hypothetical protein PGTUg99_020455 [Puccinia graminis f. sp. tritici]|nr:hypothetical protein PGTUg99_020455 [Puccinia graminis f. sp. tritici]